MKKMRKYLSILALPLFALASCTLYGGNNTRTLTEVEVNKNQVVYVTGSEISYSDVTATLIYSDSYTETISYANFSRYNLYSALYHNGDVYSSSTLNDEGEYYLYVYHSSEENMFGYIEISVSNSGIIYPTSVSIINEISMVVGDRRNISVSYLPTTANVLNFVWSSDNQLVATVDSSGAVSAVGAGEANITVSVNGTLTDTCKVIVEDSVSGDIEVNDQTGTFSMITTDGLFTQSGNIYTITSAGTYTASGSLDGQILVNAGDEDVVVLELNGATIRYNLNSPILINNADQVEISAKAGTENTIYDNRNTKTSDVSTQGEGAISAHTDLKLKGTGKLYVEGNYNNGVHSTKDVKIQKLTLKTKAYNNAIKGKDSIEIKSGTIEAISTHGDGLKTVNSDISSKGNQRGSISIESGNLSVYAAGDAIQAAYDFSISYGVVNIYTYSFSSYTPSGVSVTSSKGIKAENEINISGGTINLNTYDNGLHANYGTELENGSIGKGNVNIIGGAITATVNSSKNNKLGAKSIHADNTVNISGGNLNISSAFEGIEGNIINISGGTTYIYATDDGLNVGNKINKTPAITISGGYLDITVGTNDTDGIDSNGSFTMTGGTVISRGAPNSNQSMASGLDCDGVAQISGGTFIQLGPRETIPSLSNGVCTLNYGSQTNSGGFQPGGPGGGGRPGGGSPGSGGQSSSSTKTFSSGSWSVSTLSISFVVASSYAYYGCCIYSSLLTKNNTYTVTNGTTSYSATAA